MKFPSYTLENIKSPDTLIMPYTCIVLIVYKPILSP